MGCGEGVVKFILAGANFTFCLAGIALLSVGIWYKLELNGFNVANTELIPSDYQNLGLAPTFTIAIGAVIFLIAFFGCCGAIRESPCLLTTYSVILLVIFLIQVAVGVFAFIEIKDEASLESTVKQSLNGLFNKYYQNNETKEAIDFLQKEFECCGISGPSSWSEIGSIPESCLNANNEQFQDGCANKFYEYLYKSIKIIGIVVLSISAIEVIVSIFSLCLANTIKNRERRFRY